MSSQGKKELSLSLMIYLYLMLPVLIFILGWLRWYWALPLGLLAAYACIRALAASIEEHCLALHAPAEWKTVLAAVILIVLWVYLSGVGGYCYQNWDHRVRNAIFRALVQWDWPVVSSDGSRALIYYIGFWLPPACIGKIFGLEAGYAAQFLWAVLGILLVYYLICVYRQKVDLLPVVFLIFFSGLDYAGTWLVGKEGADLSLAYHLEWWATDFQFTSWTAQLFWVFNQAVPAWVATMLVLVQKNNKNVLWILALMMLSSTLPFVGLIPFAVCFYIRGIKEDRKRWKEAFTFQNITGVAAIGGVSFLYLIGNISGGMVGRAVTEVSAPEPAAGLLRYLLFYFLEFGVYLFFVWQDRKKDPRLWLLICILLLCPLIQVGSGADFCMRVSIPSLLVLMLFCMEAFERLREERAAGKGKYRFAIYCAVLLLGAITSFNEIHRSIRETFQRVTAGESVRYREVRVEEDLLQGGNFSGETDGNFFYQYLAKPFFRMK